MLTLYRTKDCSDCDEVEENLADLSLARKIVDVLPDNQAALGLPEGTEFPVLMDDRTVIVGRSAIQEHLDRLKEFKAEWDRFQSDACYCDEEGRII